MGTVEQSNDRIKAGGSRNGSRRFSDGMESLAEKTVASHSANTFPLLLFA